ncbi:MAG: hypothetical protein AAFX93_15275 [Verrucomicrobiota bacterium]
MTVSQDETHLNNLAIAHYAIGGVMVLFACMPLMHMFIGLSIVFGGDEFFPDAEGQPPPFIGWFFFIIGLLFFLLGQAIAISVIISGRFIKRRKNYLFSFVLACIVCAFVPFGTVLGVFTIIVLSRDSVKNLYGRPRTSPPDLPNTSVC